MMIMLCYKCKLWGPYACMYIMCIKMLPRFVMLVRTHTFDIYVCHDIMPAYPFLWHPATYNVLCQTMLDLGVHIRARLMGPCARTWTMCGEVPHIQPCP